MLFFSFLTKKFLSIKQQQQKKIMLLFFNKYLKINNNAQCDSKIYVYKFYILLKIQCKKEKMKMIASF